MSSNKLQELLGVELPIIQAPMAGVQDSALVLAVSSAGGLGSLPCAMLSTDVLESELTKIQTNSDKPYNVNFFCHRQPDWDEQRDTKWKQSLNDYFLEYDLKVSDVPSGAGRLPFSHEVADIVEKFKPPIVSFHFGLPTPDLLERVKSWGSTVLSSATTVDEALWLEYNGCDGIIAQGVEAGGHRGMFLTSDLSSQADTFSLLQQIIERVSTPVIAAGGIANPEDVSKAISLGAVAAQIGTAYLLCDEATTSQLHREKLKSEDAENTILTNVFSGRPARGIVNRAISELGPISSAVPEFPLAGNAITMLRQAAESKGSSEFSPLWCGTNPGDCKEIPASKLTIELVSKL